MSANRENTPRRLFRLRKIREERAVSPVIATLLLILIAVAAAVALWIFVNGFQTSTQSNVGNVNGQAQVTIGGSTSVYPFDQYAVAQFMANNSGITISDNQGGTGAGMLAVCHGSVDIGTASSLQTPTGLETSDGCPTTVVVTVVAYDAVDVITQVANPHGLQSISADTLLTVYVAQSSTAYTGSASMHMDGSAISATGQVGTVVGSISGLVPSAGIYPQTLEWNQIPACGVSSPVAACAGGAIPEEALTAAATWGATTITAWNIGAGSVCTNGVDTCPQLVGTTLQTPCGFTICAGPFNATSTTTAANKIQTVTRADTSGTVQTFTARLLGIGSGNNPVSSYSSLAYTGCGSDGQLDSCGITTTQTYTGNPGVISGVSSHPDAIGFASDGLARASSSGVTCQGVATGGCGIAFEGIGQLVPVQPSLGSSGTIATAITNQGSNPSVGAGQYAGWRPFSYVTTNTPTGIVAEYINWVLDPNNNQAVAADAAEISIYSV